MRLLTAIPLLFWTSTAAITHLALMLAAQPVASVAHAQAPESSIASADHEGSVTAPESPFSAVYTGVFLCRPVVDLPVAATISGVPEPGVRRLTERILHAASLSGNPPPARA